jgi:4-aminobutyrate aminotransferase
VACLIAEPIQGVGGFIVPPDGLFAAMRATLDEHGILFISDEVQTGWGRTGDHFWGYEAHGTTPDLLTFAKGLGNGLAIGGIAGRADLIDSVHANSISTFGGNPLATAGAVANLDYLLSRDLQANALARGKELMDLLAPLAHKLAVVGEVRGRGLMVAVELVEPGGRDPSPAGASAALEVCRQRGVLLGKGGVYGNVLRIAPPLSVSAAEIEQGATAITEALVEVETALS